MKQNKANKKKNNRCIRIRYSAPSELELNEQAKYYYF